jgi:hypothetical protein
MAMLLPKPRLQRHRLPGCGADGDVFVVIADVGLDASVGRLQKTKSKRRYRGNALA